MNWYIVQAYSGFENKVADSIKDIMGKNSLQNNLGEILVPTQKVVEVKKELLKEDPKIIKDQNNLNIVFMGMGEPLANYSRVIESIKILNDQKGLNIGARNITVSTVGLLPKIQELAEEKIQVNLAVSIHAPDNKTNRKIFFEYVFLSGQNDSEEHANKLGKLLRPLLCHLNLIPVNPTIKSNFERSGSENIDKFRKIISNFGVPSTIRMEKGIDINAGCGQLKSEYIYLED